MISILSYHSAFVTFRGEIEGTAEVRKRNEIVQS